MPTGCPAKGLAVAAFMVAVGDPGRRLLQQPCETSLALAERQTGYVLAIEFQKVECEIGKVFAAAIGNLLHDLE